MLKASQIAFLIVLVLIADVWGQSQRDPKHEREGSQTESQRNEAQQAPTTDQRGTDKMPFSVKIIPTTESEEKAAADAKTREEKMELDRKLVEFNGDLAYYTKVLVWVAGLQFIALIGQCVVFALTLSVTGKAANAAKQSAEVAKDSLVIATRPRITIPPPEICITAQRISFSITNGGGIAIVDRVDATVQATRGRGGATVTKPTKLFPAVLNREIEAGQSLGEYWIALDWIGAPDLRREIKAGEATLKIIFQIIAKDMFGTDYSQTIPFDFDHRKWVFVPPRLLQPENDQ
jgi:hypothetical protein